MAHLVDKITYFFEILFLMTGKEFKIRYKYTIFGFLWLVINPLLQMLVIGTIFRYFVKITEPNYYYYLLVNLLVWNYFSLTLSKTTPSFVYQRHIIKKTPVFRSVVPLSIVLANAINLLIATLCLAVFAFFYGLLNLTLLPLFLIGLVLLVMFTTGISLLTSTLNVRFRDVNFVIQALLIVWFYATPVIYTLEVIPKQYQYLWGFNPLTIILFLFRSVFNKTGQLDPSIIYTNLAIIFSFLLAGIVILRRQSKYFDDWL